MVSGNAGKSRVRFAYPGYGGWLAGVTQNVLRRD